MDILSNRAYSSVSEYIHSLLLSWVVFEILDSNQILFYYFMKKGWLLFGKLLKLKD